MVLSHRHSGLNFDLQIHHVITDVSARAYDIMRDELGITTASVATFDWSLEIHYAFVVSSRCQDFHDVSTFVQVVLLIDESEFYFLLERPAQQRVVLPFQ